MAKDIELPMDKDEWEECKIVEDVGTEDEHEDQFYRYGNFGIEACRHGLAGMTPTYEAYVIMDETPFRICDCCESFEEAVATLVHEMSSKRIEDGAWDKGEERRVDSDKDEDADEIAKSSVSAMIARNREGRKAPVKVDMGSTMPPMADGQMRTPRSAFRTVHIGEGRDSVRVPKSFDVHDEAEGSSKHRVRWHI